MSTTSRSTLRYLVATLLLVSIVATSLTAVAQTSSVHELDAMIGETQRAWAVPGLAVAIVKDGEVVLENGYGVLRLGGSEPVDEHTLFAIASNTKAFTAAALAILVDEGKLSWDDHVIDHLPYFRLHDPDATADIRIRDLLTHRAGFRAFSGDLLWYGTPYTAEEVLKRTRHLPASFPFRARYGYSNIMFIAAGEVVHQISGQPFNDFVRDRILVPLGMTRTTLEDSILEELGNVATPHRERKGHIIPLPWFAWEAADAAGGIVSSVHDMSKWLTLQLNRGSIDGDTLFSVARSKEMWAAQTVIPVSDFSRKHYPSTHFRAYGLGWSLQDYKGRKIVSHGGGYDGMFSRVAMVPEENLGVVVLTNSMTWVATAIANTILDIYLGGEESDWTQVLLPMYLENRKRFAARSEEILQAHEDLAGVPSRELIYYQGDFHDVMYGDATVRLEGDGLVLTLLPFPSLVADLAHIHSDTFGLTWRTDFAWFDGGVVQFITDPAGRVTGLRIDVPNEDLWFDELNFELQPESQTD